MIKKIKQAASIILAVMMVIGSSVPALAAEEVKTHVLKVKPAGDSAYELLQLAVPSEEESAVYDWGSGMKSGKGSETPDEFVSALDDIEGDDELLCDFVTDYGPRFDKDNAISGDSSKEKYTLEEGVYLITDNKEFYIPKIVRIGKKNVEIKLEARETEEEPEPAETEPEQKKEAPAKDDQSAESADSSSENATSENTSSGNKSESGSKSETSEAKSDSSPEASETDPEKTGRPDSRSGFHR